MGTFILQFYLNTLFMNKVGECYGAVATHRSGNSSKRQLIKSWWGWQLIEPPLGGATHRTFYTWFKPLSMSCHWGGNSSNPLKGWQLIESPLGEATHRKHQIWSGFLHNSPIGERVFCTCSTRRKLKILCCHPILTFGQASPSLSQLGRSLLESYPDLT